MKITLIPQRRDNRLTIDRQGDVLILNGRQHDFGLLAAGDVLPQEMTGDDWIVSDVRCSDGRLQLAVIVPHGPLAAAEALIPGTLELASDGPVSLPSLLS